MPSARAALLASILTVVLAALALAGCSDAASREGTGESTSDLTPFLFTNDKAAYDYFVGKGLTNFQAAGIVGNLDQESGVDPNAVQYGGGPGRGIAQWSVGGRWDTDSGDDATAYASQQGQSVWSLGLQLDFVWYELTTFSSYGLSKLRATTNVTDATVVFQDDFEGCGTCDQSQRVAYAQAVLNAYGAVDYAASFVSQSFPYASATMPMTTGQVIPSYVELKNTGNKAWDSNTRLATTQPRDRASAFADSSWIAPNRLAAVKGTVPPGGTYKFEFDLAAPATPGAYDEFFGVVQEGVTWFSDSGQGGPPDDQLEVKIDVSAAPPPPAADGGTTPPPSADDAGATPTDDAGTGSANDPDASSQPQSGVIPAPHTGGSSGAQAGDPSASGDPDASGAVGQSGGCSAAPGPASGSPFALFFVAIVVGLRRARARRLVSTS